MVSGGQVAFRDGSTEVAIAPVSSGMATAIIPGLSAGTHSISAAFSGTGVAAPSTSPAASLVIQGNAATPSVTCNSSPSSINPGESTTITGTATSPSNLPVSVSYTTTAGTLAENGGTATLNSSGATGAIQVTCHAVDSMGQTASAETTVNVNDGQGEQALSAFSFTDSVGVNIHLTYGNTQYVTDFPGFMNTMVNLGVHHYRNAVDPYVQPFVFANAETLAKAGIKGDWVIDIKDTAQNVQDIYANAPNSIDAYEGPNEDNQSVGAPMRNFLTMIRNTVHANPATASYPIYNATMTDINLIGAQGNLGDVVDNGNMHDYYYPRYPETPSYGGAFYGCGNYGSMEFNICVAKVNAVGHPVISTETGYISGTQSDAVFGKYITRTLFKHLALGVPRTYLYEMLEDVNSPNYGLVHGDYSPKPAYTAIKNLIHLFSDENYSTPGKLDYTLTGQTSNLEHALFQKKDGTWMLALWLGVSSANPVAPYETSTVPPQAVTIKTNTPVGGMTLSTMDDSGNLSTQPASSGNPVTVNVTDSVTVVSLAPR